MFFFKNPVALAAGMTFTDRGDIATPDYDMDDFTKNLSWQDKDISGIVGVGRRLVLISLVANPTVLTQQWSFRTNGNSNDQNRVFRMTMVINRTHPDDIWVWTDAVGVIEYKISSDTWTQFDVFIRGYFS